MTKEVNENRSHLNLTLGSYYPFCQLTLARLRSRSLSFRRPRVSGYHHDSLRILVSYHGPFLACYLAKALLNLYLTFKLRDASSAFQDPHTTLKLPTSVQQAHPLLSVGAPYPSSIVSLKEGRLFGYVEGETV